MAMFDTLVGISPWWWVAFGIALGALEMATMSFFLIWPALAALAMALALLLWPGLSGEAQIAVFAVLAIGLTFLGRGLLCRFGTSEDAAGGLNDRSSQMIGRHGEVAGFSGPEGHVIIDGVRWAARWQDGETADPGDRVEVTRADGMVLIVRNA